MDEELQEALDATPDTKDEVRSVIELLEKDTNYKEIPAYKKRNLVRALYGITLTAVNEVNSRNEVYRSFLRTTRNAVSMTIVGRNESDAR